MKRLVIIGLAALLALDLTPDPAPAQALPQPQLYTVISTAPRTSGTVVILDVPADLWPDVTRRAPLTEYPGMEKRFAPIHGGRPE